MNNETITVIVSALLSLMTAVIVTRWQTHQELLKFKEEQKNRKMELIRTAVAKYSFPLLLAASDLQDRLWHLTQRVALVEKPILLFEDKNAEAGSRWTMTQKHYRLSTMYLFARYFAWVEIIQEEIIFLEFEEDEQTKQFYEKVKSVERTLASTEVRDGFSNIHSDRQIFQLQQAAIGQLLLKKSENTTRCQNYNEFVQNFETLSKESDELAALENLIIRAVSKDPHDFCLARCCLFANELVNLMKIIDRDGRFKTIKERETVVVPGQITPAINSNIY